MTVYKRLAYSLAVYIKFLYAFTLLFIILHANIPFSKGNTHTTRPVLGELLQKYFTNKIGSNFVSDGHQIVVKNVSRIMGMFPNTYM